MAETESSSSQVDDIEEDSVELTLFHCRECYVYTIPPRKSSASYRADEWNINKWAWEGSMRVVSRGTACSIRLEDSKTGDLFAQAPVEEDHPLPLEPVIDSSRFFVLRIQDSSSPSNSNSGSRQQHLQGEKQGQQGQAQQQGHGSRHAFIGIGFRERAQAYDFQAAVFDHVKYLNKQKEVEEMERERKEKGQVDYSLKPGQTLSLQLKKGAQYKGAAALFKKNIAAPLNPSSPNTPGAFLSQSLRTVSGEVKEDDIAAAVRALQMDEGVQAEGSTGTVAGHSLNLQPNEQTRQVDRLTAEGGFSSGSAFKPPFPFLPPPCAPAASIGTLPPPPPHQARGVPAASEPIKGDIAVSGARSRPESSESMSVASTKQLEDDGFGDFQCAT